MQKNELKCDICDRPLTMQSGGQMAVCGYCGMQYSLNRLREKLRGQQGTVKEESENLSSEGPVKISHEDFEIHVGVLTKYHGADTDIVVPDGVLEIDAGCFQDYQYLTSVVLPDGLQKISGGAFSDCSSLETINIPDSVTEIGRSAFSGCSSLETINIPDSVTEIGRSAFSGCSSLETINIPNSVTEIGDSAFSGCSSLETINIPDSVTEIGDSAFVNCINLKNVIISDTTYKRLCPQITEKEHHDSRDMWGNYVYSHSTYSWEWDVCSPTRFYADDRVNFEDALKAIAPWFRQTAMQMYEVVKAKSQENWIQNHRCQHCGGPFEGVVFKSCRWCHTIKDY